MDLTSKTARVNEALSGGTPLTRAVLDVPRLLSARTLAASKPHVAIGIHYAFDAWLAIAANRELLQQEPGGLRGAAAGNASATRAIASGERAGRPVERRRPGRNFAHATMNRAPGPSC